MTTAEFLAVIVARFVDGLDPDRFYAGNAVVALQHRSMFNVIEPSTGFKADLIFCKDRPFSDSEFRRREPVEVLGVQTAIATVEDTILAGLERADPVAIRPPTVVTIAARRNHRLFGICACPYGLDRFGRYGSQSRSRGEAAGESTLQTLRVSSLGGSSTHRLGPGGVDGSGGQLVSGVWRITDEELIADLEHARAAAQQARTDDAWEAVAQQVERCRHYGVPSNAM